MKRFRISILLLVIASIVYSQSPQAFNYQAVLRHPDGKVRPNQSSIIKIELLRSSEDGPTVYTEEHDIQTNSLGLFSMVIGKGTSSDDFSTIDWANFSYYIKVSVNNTVMDTRPLLSVPYALHATTAKNADAANYAILDNVDDADHDPTNEHQSLSISGDQLTLSDGGGTVTLPSSSSGVQELNDLSDARYDGYSLFVGSDAGTNDNGGQNYATALGISALHNNTSGTANTAIGYRALENNTSSSDNTAVGFWALRFNDEGSRNTAMGYEALISNTTGHENTALGYLAGGNITTGSNNIIIGNNCDAPSPTSNDQLNIGNTIYGNLSSGNIGIGTTTPEFKLSLDHDGGILSVGEYESGATLPITGAGTRLIWYPRKAAFRAGYVTYNEWDDANIGDRSVAFGRETRASGDGSTAFGYHSHADGYVATALGSGTANGTFTTAMGFGSALGNVSVAMGQATAGSYFSCAIGRYNDNTGGNPYDWDASDPLFIIGNGDDSDNRHSAMMVMKDGSVLFPDVYEDWIMFTRDLYINAAGMIGYVSSSRRYKSDINPMEDISWMYKLNPVNFTYNADETDTKQYGLIAEEVEAVNPSFVTYNKHGEVETVSYSQLISPMIKALQDQQKLIEELQARIEALEAK